MIPPIEGVPSFLYWPSSPRSLTTSPICMRCSQRITDLPMIMEMIREVITALAERNEI